MSVSRRKLLQNSLLVATCATIPLSAWAAKPSVVSSESTDHAIALAGQQALSRAAFEAAVGSAFQVTTTVGKATSVWLRLHTVTDLPTLQPVNVGSMAVPPKHASNPVQTNGFMLVFGGTMPRSLPQGTYTFVHPELGTFSLLIVPDGPGTQTYTAVINRF